MAGSDGSLTLEGLAQILRDHMDGTAARFAEVGNHFAEVRAQIGDLRGEIARVAALFPELAQIVLRQVDQLEEHRREIREIFSRMEQQDARMEAMNRDFRTRMAEHDARFEGMARDIRRILDAMERRGGDGGRRRA